VVESILGGIAQNPQAALEETLALASATCVSRHDTLPNRKPTGGASTKKPL